MLFPKTYVMQIKVLRPFSTIEYTGYRYMGENEKFLPTYKLKGFFQQIQPFFMGKVDNFHYFFYAVPKETRHASMDTSVI